MKNIQQIRVEAKEVFVYENRELCILTKIHSIHSQFRTSLHDIDNTALAVHLWHVGPSFTEISKLVDHKTPLANLTVFEASTNVVLRVLKYSFAEATF